jgi:hypothetical protein
MASRSIFHFDGLRITRSQALPQRDNQIMLRHIALARLNPDLHAKLGILNKRLKVDWDAVPRRLCLVRHPTPVQAPSPHKAMRILVTLDTLTLESRIDDLTPAA